MKKKNAGAEDDRNLQLLVQTQVTEGSRRQGAKPSPLLVPDPSACEKEASGPGYLRESILSV